MAHHGNTAPAPLSIHGFPEVNDADYRKLTSKALTRVSFIHYKKISKKIYFILYITIYQYTSYDEYSYNISFLL